MQQKLTIGSRGSPLAMVQAKDVQKRLAKALSCSLDDIPIVKFTTSGDKLRGRLSEFGGKGLFVKELDEALHNGDIDLAVHSMKDVPTKLDPVFRLSAILKREDVRDGFISAKYERFDELPNGAVLGTASLRRQSQAARLRPDLKLKLLRGNVGTRLAKIEAGDCDATFLAMAGLNRLGQSSVAKHAIDVATMLPAPAQGAVGIQIRTADDDLADKLATLNHEETETCITAERAFLNALDGSCRTPVAALAEIDGSHLRFRGQALTPDGKQSFDRDTTIDLGDDPLGAAGAVGFAMGQDIRAEAGTLIDWTDL